ncbi:hypothetical protein [Endozoicomonas ascidiicola]|uniref:hypothetical protein n=1 Tax=Endozoicomonas ascidiicola TaxID=1698521 RepID=UPI00082B2B43|nr:hypothetical protein [Endozoicomonas ascidiicola]
MQRNFQKRQPKLEGRGLLEAVNSEGPHSNWLGMPDYYIHTLTVAGDEFKYLSADSKLDVGVGDTVVFRYQEVGKTEKKEKRIDKRSLGIYIDPSQYMQNN